MLDGINKIEKAGAIELLTDLMVNGGPKTYSTGIDRLDEFYKPVLGASTDISGYPYSGKTLLLFEILMGLCQHGWKHLIYAPDSGTPQEIWSHLVHKWTGKSFNPKHANHISELEMNMAVEWLSQYFTVIDRIPGKRTRIAPVDFWEYAVKEGYQTASIDCWANMDHSKGGSRSNMNDPSYLADLITSR